MPHKFNTSRRHKFAKKKYRVTNWCGYNESLRNRGDLTVWITGDARKHWAAPRRRSRGGQPRYSDLAITMCLTLGMVYRLPLRQTQGLIRSISKLMLLEISVPDFSTLSRRGRGLSLPARPKIKITDPVHLAIDSTGLKVFDGGEWLQSKYNVKAKRKRWRNSWTKSAWSDSLVSWPEGGGSLMAMGQQKDRQGDLMVSWSEMPRSPGHVFYDRLQLVLIEGGFDGFAEAVCQPYYAARMGAPSVPPGRYFRMHLVGYFEGIDSERGLEWRCSDSLSLREFLLLEMRERVPDHSWLSRTRTRLPHEVHTAIFDWVLALIAEAGLVKGDRIGVDASTMEANAALRNIVRRDTGEGYRGMLERLAQESGIETPTAEDLARLDRKRKGKKLSNQDWVSRSDPEAKIAKMKDGTTHLAYKPEHAVDLDTGAVVAAELHPADEGDTTTLPKTLAAAEANLEAVDVAPTAEDPAECVTDKGYHSRLVLKALDDGPWKSRISEPKQKGFARWHGDGAARRAVTNNRTRLLSGVAREAFKLRAEIVERSFAHNLDRGGMRRTWLRGRENVHKRYLLHVAGHNLSLLMRQLIGAGTPKEAVAGGIGALFVLVTPAGAVLVVQIVLIVSEDGETAFAAICFAVV